MMLGLVSPTEGEIIIENKNLENFSRDQILKRFNFENNLQKAALPANHQPCILIHCRSVYLEQLDATALVSYVFCFAHGWRF